MVTLANFDGRSIALDLNAAFGGPLRELGAIRREDERVAKDVDLLRTAQGMAPVADVKSKGFLRTIAPQLADQLDSLNKKRSVGDIDEFRKEAQMSIDTAKKILKAKSPAEKQKIILARAREFQSSGRDNRHLLKMSGMTPEQMDLQAQKAQMTGDASLRALPAPTEQERLAARAELAVRNPQAFNVLLREEAIQRAEEQRKASAGRAGASAAAKAAEAEAAAKFSDAFRQQVAGNPPSAAGATAATAEGSSPQVNLGPAAVAPSVPLSFGEDVGGTGSGLVESARAQLASVADDPEIAPLAQQVLDDAVAREATAGQIADAQAGLPAGTPELAFPEPVAADVVEPEPVDLVQQADAAYRQAQQETQRAIQLRDSITDPNLRKLADAEVKSFQAAEKAALENRENEIDFAKTQAPEATPLADEVANIQANVQSGILTPEQGAIARSNAVAESLKSPNHTILSAEEAKELLGDGYDETKTYQRSPDNKISPIGGASVVVNTGDDKEAVKLTERQSALTLFGSMMATTQPVFDALEGGGFDAGGLATHIATKFGDLGNFWQTPEGRKYNAAKSAWSEGVLRIQTGAAATQPEIQRVGDTYFAAIGDDAGTIAFKRQLREAYGEALGLGSGGLINPNNMKDSVISSKVNQGENILSPGAFARISAARPDLSPTDIRSYFDGLTPEEQTAINDQSK